MKIVFSLAVLLLFAAVTAHGADEPKADPYAITEHGVGVRVEPQVIPPGVTYKKADDAINDQVRADLQKRFAAGEKEVAGLIKGACVCAPGYWGMIKDRPGLKFQHAIPTSVHVPNTTTGKEVVFTGATFKEEADLALVAKELAADAGTAPVIRKLNTEEIKMFWAVISFDIEEPVFILENNGRKYLVDLLKDEKSGAYTIFWVDEMSVYRFGK